jgi:MFS family permease
MEVGWLMMPGALMSGLMMPIQGKLYDKLGPKVLIAFGLVSLTALTWVFSNLNLETAISTLTVWMIFRGMVMAFANMPTQTAALAFIPAHQVGRASALTNIVSRVASSFGLAILTAILNQRLAQHQSDLASAVNGQNLAATGLIRQLAASVRGGAKGQALALGYLQGTVSKYAFVQAIDDIFIIAAGLTLVGIIPALFLKKGKGGRRAGPAGE